MSKDDIVDRMRAGFFCREEAIDEIEWLRRDRDSWKVLAELANKRADRAIEQEAFVTYAKDGHILIGGSSEEKKEDLPCASRASHYS